MPLESGIFLIFADIGRRSGLSRVSIETHCRRAHGESDLWLCNDRAPSSVSPFASISMYFRFVHVGIAIENIKAARCAAEA